MLSEAVDLCPRKRQGIFVDRIAPKPDDDLHGKTGREWKVLPWPGKWMPACGDAPVIARVMLPALLVGHLACADDFTDLHALIKPQPGESRWMEIEWHPRVWEARRQAAAEAKPLFLMAGSGGAPAAGC
ncbi:MAG: hypothetical protein VCG02_20680 [Verrucomicrobiota bacterium]